MRVTILTDITIKKAWLDELEELVDWDITVKKTTEPLQTRYNPFFRALWGDFNWLRQKIGKADVRAYVTSREKLRAQGIKGHIGMYDLIDKDAKIDFYIGVPDKLRERAKNNDFKYNFTWMMIHEYLHGEEEQGSTVDRVHKMEAVGELKVLLAEVLKRRELLKTTRDLLIRLRDLLKKKTSIPTELTPLVERRANNIVKEMKKRGHAVRIVQGYRSIEEQNRLYAQGRTTPGKIVTNAKGGESFHNYGVAVDFVFRKEGYNASNALWQLLGAVGKKQGFEWGGDWKRFVDKPHFQMKQGYKLKDFQKKQVDYKKFN